MREIHAGAPLMDRMVAAIKASGPMRFDQFMADALFDPDHGYYASGKATIGKHGDFYTSISVGPLYGRLLASQFAQIHDALDGESFTIIEQGGHDGHFASDVLSALKREHAHAYDRVCYLMVEPFASLEIVQRERLQDHGELVRWVKTLADCEAVDGVYFSNEYADALPVRIFVKADDCWLERHVTSTHGGLEFVDLPSDESLDLPDVPTGYLAEIRPVADAWMRDVCRCVRRGVVLIADYGFPREVLYAPWRTTGTLSCYSQHRRDDAPLVAPGHKDITAHVDFTALATVGTEMGFHTAGFLDQCHFLTGVFQSMVSSARDPDAVFSARERQAFVSLTHPEMMGTQFKFLALTRGMPADTLLGGCRFAKSSIEPRPAMLSPRGPIDR